MHYSPLNMGSSWRTHILCATTTLKVIAKAKKMLRHINHFKHHFTIQNLQLYVQLSTHQWRVDVWTWWSLCILIQMENVVDKAFESNQYPLVLLKMHCSTTGPKVCAHVEANGIRVCNLEVCWLQQRFMVTYSKVFWMQTTLEANWILTDVLNFQGFKLVSFHTNSFFCLPFPNFFVHVMVFLQGTLNFCYIHFFHLNTSLSIINGILTCFKHDINKTNAIKWCNKL